MLDHCGKANSFDDDTIGTRILLLKVTILWTVDNYIIVKNTMILSVNDE